MPALKGTEMSLSYVQCSLYFVSSSVNDPIFKKILFIYLFLEKGREVKRKRNINV